MFASLVFIHDKQYDIDYGDLTVHGKLFSRIEFYRNLGNSKSQINHCLGGLRLVIW